MVKKLMLIVLAGLFVLGTGKISFAMSCHGEAAGQTAEAVTEHQRGKAVPANPVPKTEAINVGNEICPVSGEKLDEGMKPVTYEYKGKIYNLCCAMCISQFEQDPEKYIKIIEEELKAEPQKKE